MNLKIEEDKELKEYQWMLEQIIAWSQDFPSFNSDFAYEMLDRINKWNNLTDKQMAAIENIMVKFNISGYGEKEDEIPARNHRNDSKA